MGTIASLTIIDLAVEAGAQTATTIRVRNTGSIVDRFDIDLVGPASGWTRVDPPALSLFPGAEGSATITFAPPRASSPRAGTYPFGVRVRPAADPRGSTVEEGHVTVAPFTIASAEIAPETSRGSRRGRHEVMVANRGNAPVEVVVAAVDPDRRLRLGVDPGRAVVAPDARASFGVDVRVDDPFLFGSARRRPFVVSVEPGRQAPIQLRATLNQRSILPGWLPPLGGLALAGVALGVAAFALGAGPFAPAATPTPPPVAQATASPTAATPTESPSPPPSATAEVTPSPTPRITLADFKLSATGDQVTLGGGLDLSCRADNQTCRDQVKGAIRTIVKEFQNQYTGQGILSIDSLGVANALPIELTAKQPFQWAQAAPGVLSGETTKAVIDFGPLLSQPVSVVYALVETADGGTIRFVVDPGAAKELFDSLYTLPPQMTVTPATPDPGLTISQVYVAKPYVFSLPWVLGSPAP